ncbi:MAG: phosphoribosyltransferase family protein [Candidatus Levybacteria bacterium]|nr:phosphoribosyltransferase family protein [Candidatus Levybacteria bacterium]MDZ4227633.1 phosphoribosyltransferase family protein [Candidatus Levybacteria bacterium]
MFKNREEAGELLTKKLEKIIKDQDWTAVALLRGGIVLGKIISDYFRIPLFPLCVKKIGAPSNPELGIGAITGDKTFYLDEDIIDYLGVSEEYLRKLSEIKSKEAWELQDKFKDKISLKNKKIVIVDDGVATGATAICASIYAKKHSAQEIILATPVIGEKSLRIIKKYFNKIIALKIAENLGAIGEFYEHFPQVKDEEVLELI